MSHPLELESFLTALREAGVHVGVTEITRLHQVFALQPELANGETNEATRRRLQAVMRAILVKSHEDWGTFDRVYDNWLTQAGHEVQVLTEPVPRRPAISPDANGDAGGTRPKRPIRRWHVWATGMMVLLVVAFGLYWGFVWSSKQPIALVAPHGKKNHKQLELDTTPTVLDPRKSTFTSYVPQLTVDPPQPARHTWFLTFTGLAFLTTAIVWRVLSRRRWLPAPAPEPTRPGPPRVFLQPMALTEPQLVDTRQQETLVWGIGRFMADEPTRHLDLTATVNAMARAGGIAELHFERASYQREVWLWVDEAADDPSIMRLADEVEGILGVHGLPVERATFRGLPEHLVTSTGEVFAPHEIDERRDVALVAVLTDGRVLMRQYDADDRRVRINALLRGLSHWPRLAFVDFSAGDGGLAAILVPHDVECIAPMDLAMFLGGGAVGGQEQYTHHDDAVWAAACALAPTSVDEATALALRQRLRLQTSAWALRALRTEAPGMAGRLQWTPFLRAGRINWLQDIEANDGVDGVPTEGVLAEALAFWNEQYAHELEARGANDATAPWKHTPAEQTLLMEHNLLRLWTQPDEAILALYGLYQGRLQEAIRQHLGHLAPRDWGGVGQIHMPWEWRSCSDVEKAMLQEMGFGGDMPPEQLERPGRLWVGVGACLGLAVAALLAVIVRSPVMPIGPPRVVYDNALPPALQEYEDHWMSTEPASSGTWQVSVAAPKVVRVVDAPSVATVRVTWKEQAQQPCVETLGDGAELWYCGHLEDPVRLKDIARSLVVLQSEPRVAAVEELAIALLDSGSADVVLIAADWQQHHERLLGGEGSSDTKQQLLVVSAQEVKGEVGALPSAPGLGAWIAADTWQRLTDGLRRADGEQRLVDIWPQNTLADARGDVQEITLRGLGERPPIDFVRIAGGSFMIITTVFVLRTAHVKHPGEYADHCRATHRRFWHDGRLWCGGNRFPLVQMRYHRNRLTTVCDEHRASQRSHEQHATGDWREPGQYHGAK